MGTQLLDDARGKTLTDKTESHPFIPNATTAVRRKMLDRIGVPSIEDLYADIPPSIRVRRPLKVRGADSEQEVLTIINTKLSLNRSANDSPSFLGAGVYNHYIPAAVKAITSRVEFQTAYTPYQAEASQGLLQALFEFQSLIADLAGVDVVNSSVYDGSNAIAEAVRMAVRATGRRKVLVPRCLHPDRLSVLRNYTEPSDIVLQSVEFDRKSGGLDMEDLESKLDSNTAAVYFEVPSFFGILDDHAAMIPDLCHRRGSLSIVGFDVISLGSMKGPGEYGADIVVAEGQSIASEMNYGGPLLGIIGCRGESLVRQMPGRIIGETTTLDGSQAAYAMVLQTREQHIRRERATSNICTNEALLAVGAAVYLSLLGPQGLRQLCETITARTSYAIDRLSSIDNLSVPIFSGKHYQEFPIGFETKNSDEVNRRLLEKGIHGGRVLDRDFPGLGGKGTVLLCVTEQTSVETIDRLAHELREIVGG